MTDGLLLFSGTVVQPAPWRTGAALRAIWGDYGSVADMWGVQQFSVFWLTLLDDPNAQIPVAWNDQGQPTAHALAEDLANDWDCNWKSRGYSHIALTRRYSYPGSPIPGRDFTIDQFVKWVIVALDRGYAPVIFLSDVPSDPILETVQALKDRGLLPYVICVPAWEPIPTGEWTSRQLSDILIGMKAIGGADITIGVHLQPGRWSMSSNPPEADDPWHGSESGCWKSHGGEFVDLFLYQFEHGFTNTTAPDWQNRWRDGVPRMGNGMNGWRIMPIVAYETVLYDSYRGHCNEARARQIAGEARDLAKAEFGVTVSGYGNGTPTP